jgi:hypothetical protein
MNLMTVLMALRGAAMVSLCLGAGTAAAADIYRWTDANGDVQFGDRPPVGAQVEEIRVRNRGGAQGDIARQERTERLLQEFETERAERAEQEAAAEREAAERAAACDEARNRHFEYQNSGYLYEWDENGEKRVLSDAQHREARAEARADVDKWCD